MVRSSMIAMLSILGMFLCAAASSAASESNALTAKEARAHLDAACAESKSVVLRRYAVLLDTIKDPDVALALSRDIKDFETNGKLPLIKGVFLGNTKYHIFTEAITRELYSVQLQYRKTLLVDAPKLHLRIQQKIDELMQARNYEAASTEKRAAEEFWQRFCLPGLDLAVKKGQVWAGVDKQDSDELGGVKFKYVAKKIGGHLTAEIEEVADDKVLIRTTLTVDNEVIKSSLVCAWKYELYAINLKVVKVNGRDGSSDGDLGFEIQYFEPEKQQLKIRIRNDFLKPGVQKTLGYGDQRASTFYLDLKK